MSILLNDCSVLLNLLAADCLPALIRVTGWQFAICPAVRAEVMKWRDAHTGEMIGVDLGPLIASGVLQVLELAGEKEETLYVEQAMTVDDGEAMSIAIAANRQLDLAIDDKQAANHALRKFPALRLWSTPEILKHWSDKGNVPLAVLKEAVLLIEGRARYFPAKSHALAGWWRSLKEDKES